MIRREADRSRMSVEVGKPESAPCARSARPGCRDRWAARRSSRVPRRVMPFGDEPLDPADRRRGRRARRSVAPVISIASSTMRCEHGVEVELGREREPGLDQHPVARRAGPRFAHGRSLARRSDGSPAAPPGSSGFVAAFGPVRPHGRCGPRRPVAGREPTHHDEEERQDARRRVQSHHPGSLGVRAREDAVEQGEHERRHGHEMDRAPQRVLIFERDQLLTMSSTIAYMAITPADSASGRNVERIGTNTSSTAERHVVSTTSRTEMQRRAARGRSSPRTRGRRWPQGLEMRRFTMPVVETSPHATASHSATYAPMPAARSRIQVVMRRRLHRRHRDDDLGGPRDQHGRVAARGRRPQEQGVRRPDLRLGAGRRPHGRLEQIGARGRPGDGIDHVVCVRAPRTPAHRGGCERASAIVVRSSSPPVSGSSIATPSAGASPSTRRSPPAFTSTHGRPVAIASSAARSEHHPFAIPPRSRCTPAGR